jgi:hypothetical protein
VNGGDPAEHGFYSARRGTYRIVYRIDEAKHHAEIHSIRLAATFTGPETS